MPNSSNLILANKNYCSDLSKSGGEPIFINDGRWFTIQKLIDICFSDTNNKKKLPIPMAQAWGALYNYDPFNTITMGSLYCLPREIAYEHFKQVNLIPENQIENPRVQLELKHANEKNLSFKCEEMVSYGMKTDFNFDGVDDFLLSHIPFADNYVGWCGASGPCRVWMYDGKTKNLLGEFSPHIIAFSNVIFNGQPIIISSFESLKKIELQVKFYNGKEYVTQLVQTLSAESAEQYNTIKKAKPYIKQIYNLPAIPNIQ